MWYLYFSLNFEASLHAKTLASQLVFALIGVTNPVDVDLKLNHTIETFTYYDAIHGLWVGHNGPPNPKVHTDPGVWGKISAAILILFSGFWPHIKLICLQYHYHRQCKQGEEEARTTSLYWLDTFGKWSLADVFVICTLLAVLNLDLPVDAGKLAQALVDQLAVIARDLTNDSTATDAARAVCQALFFERNGCPAWTKEDDCYNQQRPCAACACALERAFPTADLVLFAADAVLQGVEADGQGLAVLRVAGRSGIYVFCLGTIMSLGLSAFIDVLDHRARAKRRIRARTVADGQFYQSLSDARVNAFERRQSVLRRGEQLAREYQRERVLSGTLMDEEDLANESLLAAHWLPILSILGLFICVGAIFVPTVKRRVPGSVTDLIVDDLDLDFGRSYSIYSLTSLAGAAGGPDYLLMGVFGLFVVVGPIIRSLLTVVLVLAPLTSRQQEKLALVVNSIGVFSALDVLLLAFFLVGLEMPRITAGIISPEQPICRVLHQLGENTYCVSIELLYIWPWFILEILAWIIVVACAARVVRVSFFVFDPFGDGYPGAPAVVSRLAEGYLCGFAAPKRV